MKNDISPIIHKLIEALRLELQEYGEMLALLDRQQTAVVNRAADDVLKSVGFINDQLPRIQAARQCREACQNQLAGELGYPGESTFSKLVPLLPEKFRAGLEILVRENNQLLLRIQNRTRQNHLLLTRSLQMMQDFMKALMPASGPTTYNETGQVQSGAMKPQSLYEAVG
jgi:hypothetical protein